jgi:hypothetical protein
VEIAKIFLKLAKLAGIDVREAVVDEGELGFFLLQLGLEDLSRAGNGIALVVGVFVQGCFRNAAT